MIYQFLGGLLLCGFLILDTFVRLRMKSIGSKWIFLRGGTFNYSEYLRVRAKHGWSAWPVLMLLVMVIAGITLIIIGMVARYGFSPTHS
jgi:hypothetical protein